MRGCYRDTDHFLWRGCGRNTPHLPQGQIACLLFNLFIIQRSLFLDNNNNTWEGSWLIQARLKCLGYSKKKKKKTALWEATVLDWCNLYSQLIKFSFHQTVRGGRIDCIHNTCFWSWGRDCTFSLPVASLRHDSRRLVASGIIWR